MSAPCTPLLLLRCLTKNADPSFSVPHPKQAVATVLTYPLQIAQSKPRADKGKAKDTSQRQYTGTMDCMQKIVAKDGSSGLFRGTNAKLWQTVLTAAFQFLTYETISGLVFAALLGGKNKGAASMSIAGSAKVKK